MGVPKFFGVFLRNVVWGYIKARNFPAIVAALGIDLNSLIHEAAQLVYVYGKGKSKNNNIYALQLNSIAMKSDEELELLFFQVVAELIMATITAVNPIKFVYLAVDGVPPKAKMDNQRARRFGAMKDKIDEERKFKGSRNKPISPRFDNVLITPGTPMMFRLDKFLREWLRDYTENSNVPIIIYSPVQEPGEGEHKIFDFIRSNMLAPTDVMVVNGLDADLIMLSLLAPLKNILVARTEFYLNEKYYSDNQDGRQKMYYTKQSEIYNIANMRDGILKDFDTPTAVEDFVVMSYLIGLDFLPRQPSLETVYPMVDKRSAPADKIIIPPIGLNAVIHMYKQLKISLTREGEIDWHGVLQLFTHMARFEPELLKYETQRPMKHPSQIGKDSYIVNETGTAKSEITREMIFSYELFRKKWYDNALKPRGPVAQFPDKDNFYDISQEQINHMCNKYLQGLGWCFNYYQGNFSYINIDWYYGEYYTPLFYDLYKYLSINTNITGYRTVSDLKPFNMVEQLMAVLPPTAHAYLPYNVQDYVKQNSLLGQYSPLYFDTTIDGKDTDYEKVTWIPFFSPMLIRMVFNQFIRLDTHQVDQYQAQGSVVYKQENAFEKIQEATTEQRLRIRAENHEATLQQKEIRRGKYDKTVNTTRSKNTPTTGAINPINPIVKSRAFVDRNILLQVQQALNPKMQWQTIENKGSTFVIAQDNILPGGTLQRGLGRYMLTSTLDNGKTVQEFVYYGPNNSINQVAVAYACAVTGKKCTIIIPSTMNNKPNNMTLRAQTYNPNIIVRKKTTGGNTFADLTVYSKQYVNDAKISTELLPRGLDNIDLAEDLSYSISKALPNNMQEPPRLWLTAESPVLLKALHKIWPNTQYLIVQLGYKIPTETLRNIDHIIYDAPEKSWQCLKPDQMPPYGSLACYDAKAWQFIKQYGKHGDYIWNSGQDI